MAINDDLFYNGPILVVALYGARAQLTQELSEKKTVCVRVTSFSSASIRSGLEIRNMSIIGATHVHCSI